MSDAPTRRWIAIYLAVVFNQALIVFLMWLFSRHFAY